MLDFLIKIMTVREKLDNIKIILEEANFYNQHNSVWFLTDIIVCDSVDTDYRFIHYGNHNVKYITVELSRSRNSNNFDNDIVISGKLENDRVYNEVVGFLKSLKRTYKLEKLV